MTGVQTCALPIYRMYHFLCFPVTIGAAGNYDHLISIENIVGTKNVDIIKGSDDFAVTNTLNGYKGNDTFYASKGIDSFIGGFGTDTLEFVCCVTPAQTG